MDPRRVDSLIRYALALRSQGDFGENELGAIHLLKYVYLADLAHAEKHGSTYTGAPWVFYHFGPWAQPVHERIDAVAKGPGVVLREAVSFKHEVDLLRLRIEDAEEIERELERQIPTHAALVMKRRIQEYGDDTAGLLHYVYATAPMIRARPQEALVFPAEPETTYPRSRPAPKRQESAREAKKRKKRLEELRQKARARLGAPPKGLKRPAPPRYDEVFFQGIAALDQAANEELPSRGTLRFDQSVWDSEARQDPRDDDS